MPDTGRILYARADDGWIFRFEGNIRYTQAHPLDAFFERVFACATPRSVIADLRDTIAIDSTGIGLLAKLARIARERSAPRPLLFCGNAEVQEILDSVCMDKVFTIVDAELPPGSMAELPNTNPSESDLARTIAGAHRLLCELSDENRACFEGVVEAFARLEGEH